MNHGMELGLVDGEERGGVGLKKGEVFRMGVGLRRLCGYWFIFAGSVVLEDGVGYTYAV